MNKSADFETVRQIKEKLCYIRSVILESQHNILLYLPPQYWILTFVTNCCQQRLQTGIPTRARNDNSCEELHCKPTIFFFTKFESAFCKKYQNYNVYAQHPTCLTYASNPHWLISSTKLQVTLMI
jgi:hypothetical protein